MLHPWREESVNYFNYPCTNDFLEDKDNRSKLITGVAYGYRNPGNSRDGIMFGKRQEAQSVPA